MKRVKGSTLALATLLLTTLSLTACNDRELPTAQAPSPVPVEPAASPPDRGTVKPSSPVPPPETQPEAEMESGQADGDQPAAEADGQPNPDEPLAAKPAEPRPSKLEYISSETAPDAAIEQAILAELPGYDRQTAADFEVRYHYNWEDLNGDGQPEALVYLSGNFTCGSGGCTMLVLEPKGEDFSLVSKITLVNAPVIVASSETGGWKDLILGVRGGGVEPYYARLQFDGSTYGDNPSMVAEVPADQLDGTAVLSDSLDRAGIILQPVQ